MSYNERRKNNTSYLIYDSPCHDHDLYFLNQETGNYFVKRDREELDQGEMILRCSRSELPQMVREYFDSLGIEVEL